LRVEAAGCPRSGFSDLGDHEPQSSARPQNPPPQAGPELYPFENILFRHALVRCDRGQDRIQRANPKGVMCWNGNALMAGGTGLKNDGSADLMHLPVLPSAAEAPD